MTPERLAELRAGPDGKDWMDVKLFMALFDDGSAITFPLKGLPPVPKDFDRISDEVMKPYVWSAKVPMFVSLRMDKVTAITEVDIPNEERRWTWAAER